MEGFGSASKKVVKITDLINQTGKKKLKKNKISKELTDQMREKFKKTSAFKKLERSSKSIRVGEMCKD